jgi:uncharacterized repeat protein (TIGR01451 family)
MIWNNIYANFKYQKTKFLLLLLTIFASSIVSWGQFTQGRLVVLQVGDGSAALTSAAAPVFLKEFTTAGVAGTSVTLPSSGVTALTVSGLATTEGALSRSQNGQYLGFAGYRTGVAATATDRVIVRVSANGLPNTLSAIPNSEGYSASSIRGAVFSNDGNQFWTSGTGTGGGVRTNTLGSTSGSIQVSSTFTNTRSIGIFNNQLYISSGASSFHGVSSVGSGTPTNAGNAITILSGFPTSSGPSPLAFVVNPAGNIIYVADDRATGSGGGIQKWTLSAGTWSLTYTINAASARGITVDFSGTDPIIYATTTEASNRLIKITDTGASSAATTIATAPTNTAFRGVAFAPVGSGVTITQSDGITNVTEGGATDTYNVVLNTQPIADVTVTINNGTQTTTNPTSLTFTTANWNVTQTVTVTAIDDAVIEGPHTGSVSHTAASSDANYNGISVASVTANITDNDAPSLTINDVSLNEGNAGTTSFTFTVSLSAPAPAGGVTFDIATANGTAIQPSDYTTKLLNGQTIPAGSSTYTFDVLVNGDATPETNETFFVNVTNVNNAIATDGQGLGTIVNDDITFIHDVQGNGAVTPIPGSTVTIQGIVVGDFENSLGVTNLTGFYVQEEDTDADADPATSEGIFVFKGAGNTANDVAVGDLVTITGTVAEFSSSAGGHTSSMTQLTSPIISKISSGNTLPAATSVQLPVSNVNDLERYEGMSVNLSAVSGNLAVTEYFELGRYGQVVLAATGASNQTGTDARLDQYTQFNAPDVAGNTAYLAEIAKRSIYLDDGRSVQNPDPILFGRGGNPLSASNTLRGGDEVAVVAGILDERLEGYRIQTLTCPNFIATNTRLSSPPSLGSPTLKISSFNVLNYFNDLNSGSSIMTNGLTFQPRGANTAAEFTRQRDKIIQAIINGGADVLGIMEMENNGYGASSAIQNLIDGLNAAAGAGTYTFVNPGSNISTDAITVGIIYKPAKVELVGSAAAIPFAHGTGSFINVGRRSLAQTLRQKSNGAVFTLVVNHFKSKGSSAGGTGDTDTGDGQGASNGTRTRQAQDLATWLATNPTGTADPDYLLIGDFNAYAKEDPITALATAGYNNLLPITSYSYVFDGMVGSLDHALGASSLASQVTGTAKWHINADEPSVLDYNTEFKSAGQITSFYSPDPFRSSDHDAVMIGLSLTAAADLAITKTDGVMTATPGGSVTYTITASNSGPDNVIGATVSDLFPTSLTATWTCAGVGGGTCTGSGSGNISDMVNLPSGGSVIYTVTAAISPSATGTLSNTAIITAPADVIDPTPGNNSATDTDVLTPQANLAITKTDGVTSATPGGSVTYTITASNAGPSNVTGATVADVFPAFLTATWTCVGAVGGSCTPSGSGNISDMVNLPSGGSVTYTVTAAISPSATGTLSNTATVTAPGGVTDPTPGNNSATDIDALNPQADLAISVTDTPDPVLAGNNLTYTITVTNSGPSNAASVSLANSLPAGTTFVSLSAPGGWSSSTPAVGATGTVSSTISSLAPGSAVFTLVVAVAPSVASGTVLSNTATITAATTDPNPANNSGTATTAVAASADVSVTLIDTPDPVLAGNNLTYTITVTNSGPSNAASVSLANSLPAGTTFVSLSAPGGWSSSTPAVGATGTVSSTISSLAPGSAVFTLVVAVNPTLADASTLTNTATVAAATTDPNPANNSGTATTLVSNPCIITAYSVTGGGSYCPAGTGVPVGLSGSQSGFNYQLLLGGNPVGSLVTGTGAAISFGNQLTVGTYTVTAIKAVNPGCTAAMTGSATVTLFAKPTINLSVNGQTLNEGNTQTLCDTDANPVNALQFPVSGSCAAGSLVWRTQIGAGAWSAWSATAPSSQPSDNMAYRYQAACSETCPVSFTEPITLTINYRASTPQNVSLVADGVTVAAGESKTVCDVAGNTIAFNAACAPGEILLYSVDGGDFSATLPSQIVDNVFHNYRVRCRKADGTPSCVETESAAMSLKITASGPAPTVSITPTSGCGTPTPFSGTSTCGALSTIWFNAATDAALPTLPTVTPNATASFYARCQNEAGCLSEKSNTVTFTITPVNEPPTVTVSAEIVCTGTPVTLSANCPAGASAFWNTGVSESSFQVAFSNVTKQTYWAKCIFPNGCQSSESAKKTVFWKAFELTFINIGQSQSAIKPANDRNLWSSQFITKDAGPVLEQSTQVNPTIYYSENVNKTAPRFWTVQVETCALGTNGSITYDMLAAPEAGIVRSYNTHENNAPYLMYANRDGFTELYAQNHPAYGFFQDNGSGGNTYDEGLPKGLYKLSVRYWDQKGQGSIYPSKRQPQGNVLAYQEYWFRIQSSAGVGTGAARVSTDNGQRTTDNGSLAQVMPNPVANILHLKVNEAKGQNVNVSLTDASGRALLQRTFVPQTNQHQEEFEVSHLSNGMYFLQVNTADKKTTLKVIKVQ